MRGELWIDTPDAHAGRGGGECVCVYCLTWQSNSKLLVEGNPRGIRYFTCWSEHMKHNDKLLLKETMRKLQLLQGIEPHPQGWESKILTTAPIPLTCRYKLYLSSGDHYIASVYSSHLKLLVWEVTARKRILKLFNVDRRLRKTLCFCS